MALINHALCSSHDFAELCRLCLFLCHGRWRGSSCYLRGISQIERLQLMVCDCLRLLPRSLLFAILEARPALLTDAALVGLAF